jgi:aspartyl protease family protein
MNSSYFLPAWRYLVGVRNLHTFFLAFLLISVSFATTKDIAIVGLSEGRAMLEIDGQYRVLSNGETSPEGITLVSANSEQAILEVEGLQTIYGLSGIIQKTPPTSPSIRDWQPPYKADMNVTNPPATSPVAPASVKILPNEEGMYIVAGRINGYPVNFLVDTGASTLALNSQLAKQLGIDYRQGKKGRARTASGVVETHIVQLDQVQVGHITVETVTASIVEGLYPTEILLGMSFLNRVDIHREDKLLELRPQYQ